MAVDYVNLENSEFSEYSAGKVKKYLNSALYDTSVNVDNFVEIGDFTENHPEIIAKFIQ
ncbi:MAG: hypothetical protein J6P87_06550 [Lachnospiraceae bacterium]|nr:hypothetical protein [Lachnospiraceae bacterium]